MPKYLLGMPVCNKHLDYFKDTLRNFERSIAAGTFTDFEVRLFDTGDGVSNNSPFAESYTWRVPDVKLTANENAAAVFTDLGNSECEYAVFFEDDLKFCLDFVGSVDRWLTRRSVEYPLYAFYASYSQIREQCNKKRDFWRYPTSHFYGTQCVCVKRGLAKVFGEAIKADTRPILYDMVMKDVLGGIGRYLLASAPCFVEHVGIRSSIHTHAFHQSFQFIGENRSYQ